MDVIPATEALQERVYDWCVEAHTVANTHPTVRNAKVLHGNLLLLFSVAAGNPITVQ